MELRERFDVFGFDVRGVGLSGQLQCWDDAEYSQAVSNALGRPLSGAAFRRAVRQAKDFDAACMSNSADLLPYVGTGYVARDIDLLRQALGERKLTFYRSVSSEPISAPCMPTFSQIGCAQWCSMVPITPDATQTGPTSTTEPSTARSTRRSSGSSDGASRMPTQCSFGNGHPRSAFERLTRALDKAPVAHPRSRRGQRLHVGLPTDVQPQRRHGGLAGRGTALRQAQKRDGTSFLLHPPHRRLPSTS